MIADGDAQSVVDDYRDKLEPARSPPNSPTVKPDEFAVDWSKYLSGKLSRPGRHRRAKRDKLAELPRRSTRSPPRSCCIRASPRSTTTAARWPPASSRWTGASPRTSPTPRCSTTATSLRLVGQDCGRGTFFHRHAVLHDQKTGGDYLPLRQLVQNPRGRRHHRLAAQRGSGDGVRIRLFDRRSATRSTSGKPSSAISPTARRSSSTSSSSSGEAKWDRLCGLALFLPHGYEGQGPEHSSARLERFLQLCALDNMQVCVPTTPAQMFHMLRRQMLHEHAQAADRDDAEVAAAPQAGGVDAGRTRQRRASSSLIPDTQRSDPKKVKRVVLCSGKVYYDLLEDAQKRKIDDVAIVRVEQLYPFPRKEARRRTASATPRRRTSSGARKSRRTRARGTRSSTTSPPACAEADAALRRPRALALARRAAISTTTSPNRRSWSPMRWSNRARRRPRRRITARNRHSIRIPSGRHT